MDQVRIGELIRSLRIKNKLTQKQLAQLVNVSDKAVSKWETGNGCPDISILSELAGVFCTDVQTLLSGEIDKNESEKGNMKKLKFYVCKDCGNIITATSAATITCCGNKLSPLEARKAEPGEQLKIEDIGGELFISSDHEMTKQHYITFVAYVNDSSITLIKQYPEWDLQLRLPLYRTGKLVWYCTNCGLLYQDIRQEPIKNGR